MRRLSLSTYLAEGLRRSAFATVSNTVPAAVDCVACFRASRFQDGRCRLPPKVYPDIRRVLFRRPLDPEVDRTQQHFKAKRPFRGGAGVIEIHACNAQLHVLAQASPTEMEARRQGFPPFVLPVGTRHPTRHCLNGAARGDLNTAMGSRG